MDASRSHEDSKTQTATKLQISFSYICTKTYPADPAAPDKGCHPHKIFFGLHENVCLQVHYDGSSMELPWLGNSN